jgi:hypothetical protein|uniref:Uncharacterized protein n=1 Tax=Zea mays TaxID=4577 RepID=C0PLK3_MAIZE|nr:unknown [Zea mays]
MIHKQLGWYAACVCDSEKACLPRKILMSIPELRDNRRI